MDAGGLYAGARETDRRLQQVETEDDMQDDMRDTCSALDWLIVEMISAQFGGAHPFERLRREGVMRLVTGARPKAPDVSESADWTFRIAD